MGFEEQLPPVPDRLAEIKMLDRLEQSWLDQPYNRYYMNEDLRQTKMEYASYNLTARRKFLQNCLLISAVTLPLAYVCRRFVVYNNASSIPFTRPIPHFHKQTNPYLDRSKASNTTFIAVWLASTVILGYNITDWHYRSDENYDRFSKVKKML